MVVIDKQDSIPALNEITLFAPPPKNAKHSLNSNPNNPNKPNPNKHDPNNHYTQNSSNNPNDQIVSHVVSYYLAAFL